MGQTVQEALIEAMVIGAERAGGLSPERADALLTLMLEHDRFEGLDEDALREMLARACEQANRPARLDEIAPLLRPEARVCFQLMFLVADADPAAPMPEGVLLPAAGVLGLSPEQAEEIIALGVPPELDILRAGPAPEEVYLDVLLAAAASDGHLAPEELEALVQFASTRLELRLLPRHEIEDLMMVSLQGFLDHGVFDWLETLPASLPSPEHRQTALRLAEEMVAADSLIHHEEARFLAALRQILQLDPQG